MLITHHKPNIAVRHGIGHIPLWKTRDNKTRWFHGFSKHLMALPSVEMGEDGINRNINRSFIPMNVIHNPSVHTKQVLQTSLFTKNMLQYLQEFVFPDNLQGINDKNKDSWRKHVDCMTCQNGARQPTCRLASVWNSTEHCNSFFKTGNGSLNWQWRL